MGERRRMKRRQLPEASRHVLTWIAEELRDGYTGQLILECHNGGVRYVKRGDGFEPGEIKEMLDHRREGCK